MYAPSAVPTDSGELSAYLVNELRRLAQSLNEPVAFAQIEMSYAAPAKVRDGMLVLADGTSWNPGSGAGFYGYYGGSWKKLG